MCFIVLQIVHKYMLAYALKKYSRMHIPSLPVGLLVLKPECYPNQISHLCLLWIIYNVLCEEDKCMYIRINI